MKISVPKLLRLDFLPHSADAGLLVLRLWLGLSMLFLHGWSKVTDFSAMADQFPDPIGLGSRTSLVLAAFAEAICSALIVLGLFTRFAAIVLAINMATAFFLVHKSALTGPNSGELAFLYLAGWVTLLVAGPGRFSLDAKMGR
ncbi:MAG: DoxX family protein [Verrucomicrobia bacterium]|nr:DoxX family protein [Verrucomicrobiota bacterium]